MTTQREKDEQQAEYRYGDRNIVDTIVDTDLLTEGFVDGAAYGRRDAAKEVLLLLDRHEYERLITLCLKWEADE